MVTNLNTALYGSGLRKGTYSVREPVDIKMVVKGGSADRLAVGTERQS